MEHKNYFVCRHGEELWEDGRECEKGCDRCEHNNRCCSCIGEQKEMPGEFRFEVCKDCVLNQIST